MSTSMLGSWLRQPAGDDTAPPERQSRSFDLFRTRSASSSTNDLQDPRSSLDKPRSNKRSQLAYSTPHDTVLSQLQPISKGYASSQSRVGPSSDQAGPHPHAMSPESNASQSRLESGMSPSPSIYTSATANLRYAGNQSNIQVQPQTVDLLLDPFDGTSHGVLLPQDINIVSRDQDRGSIVASHKLITDSDAPGSSGEAMWSHLSRVLDLQSQIARMHIEMEGVGAGDGKRGKGKLGPLGRSPNSMEDTRVFHGNSRFNRKRTMSSSISTVESGDEKGADEEGVGVVDEEVEQNKAREEEFAKLADQFEGKKESIRDIMDKLDDLSKALTEFHALQAPKIEISSSRRSSTGITIQNSPPATRDLDGAYVEEKSQLPVSHASSLPPFATLWTPPKTPFSTTSPHLLPQSFSRIERKQPRPRKPVVPTVLVNSKELGPQRQMVDSPASTLGSLQLHPE